MISSFYVLRQLFDTAVLHPQKLAIVLDDQSWTYSELIEKVQHVAWYLHRLNIVQGQIVYQFIERSFEMICGLFGIMCVGGVYCPINPADPLGRVGLLLDQIRGEYVLLHQKTRRQFPSTAIHHLVLLDAILLSPPHAEAISAIPICSEYGPVYIICTSGTTGQQKAVVHTHRSFSASNYAFAKCDFGIYTIREQVLQVASCSWILHLTEISLPLILGGTLILLRPDGHMDMAYFSQTLLYQQVTTLLIGSGIIRALTNYFEISQRSETLKFVHNLCMGGETVKPLEWIRFTNFLRPYNIRVISMYGMTEFNAALGCQLQNIDDNIVPLGYPLPGYRCLLIDEQGRLVSKTDNLSEVGQIHVGGSGLFNCYLGDSERTADMFVMIDNQVYLKTGDLARYNARGELVHAGRIDFQIKIRGQRVQTNEIENTIINWSPDRISNCLVIKDPQNDDLLIAYVISNDLELDIEEIRSYCNKHLRQYMIPSMFMVLKQFPLNANGKVDRRRLPMPDFSVQSNIANDRQYTEPKDKLEMLIHALWCDILCCSRISTNVNIFSIGGHSLLFIQLYQGYTTMFGFDIHSLDISELFKHPTIANHARLISHLVNKQQETKIPSLPSHITQVDAFCIQEPILHAYNISFISYNKHIAEKNTSSRYQPFPLTNIQQAYLLGRGGYIELGHVSCFSYQEYDLPSDFDIGRLEKAFNHLIQRHEALRIIFASDTEQKILATTPYYTIDIFNLCDVVSVKEKLIKRRIQLSHQVRPANQWPLFDIKLTRFIDGGKHQLRIHIGFDILIMDLWSLNLVLSQLNQLYYHSDIILPTINYSYRDYILAQNQIKDTLVQVQEADKKYWIDRLHSFPLGPNLPLHCLPNKLYSQRFIRFQRILERSVWDRLEKRIRHYQLTPAGFLASIYAIVLAKWSDNQHFAINLPTFNRLPIHPQIYQVVGDFTSITPLEVNLKQKMIFGQFIQTVQKQLWNDLMHTFYDGVSFIRELMHVNQTTKIVLPFVFACGLFNSDFKDEVDQTYSVFEEGPVYEISQTPQVYLDNQVFEKDKQLIISWDHVENLFPPSMINDIQNAFIDLLHRLTLSDEMWQEPIFISLPAEQQIRRFAFNETKWEPTAKAKSLHVLVIEQAQRVPNAWSILSSRKNLTYKHLMNRVYSLAYHLQQQQQGVQSNQLVAILMRKGWEQVVACLAILISGAAYLPLDIDSPYDRLCELIKESNVKIILTQSDCQHTFTQLITIPVDTFTSDKYPQPFPIKQQLSTDLAYVIYTSGSTGKPKGVMISHQAVLNTILDINSRLEISTNDRIFALSHFNFDLSVYDIFGMLIAGGTIVIPDHENYKNPKYWYDMMIKHHVTIWNSVPMLMQMLVEHLQHTYSHNQLRHILVSGDWIPLSLSKSIQTTFGEQVTITSLGGATEASIWSIAFTLPKQISQEWKSIPYGTPLRNQQYYVYDIHLDDCPEWVNGELYIGGIGLADGYWNDPEKTQSSFIIHPRTGERLYRTGDYGRFVPNGYIEFMGRKDFQVKVHGHRIELGEIEYHLQQHSDIYQTIVTVDTKSQQLIGYIIPEKHSAYDDDYDQSEIEITDSIERTHFKLARHSQQHQYEVRKSFSLTKPNLTERLINTYYTRKSYRQFTNEIIKKSTIEYLLRKCQTKKSTYKISRSNVDFDTLSQLLSVLTPINVSNQVLPKYRYASSESLYPIQIYIELHRSINNISPGIYYHNPDKHTLEFVDLNVSSEKVDIRLHLIGRSSAIAPLYGKILGSQFCALETGYIMGLLQQEASELGWTLTRVTYDEETIGTLDLNEDDTHYCFEVSTAEEYRSDNNNLDHLKYVVYLKSVKSDKDEWFFYDREKNILISFDMNLDIAKEEMPLFFDNANDTKIIFHDCSSAIFFIGQSEHRLNTGLISHLLMDSGLEMNIGICPIDTRKNLPEKINNTLDNILAHYGSIGDNMLLHTLCIGKISDEQKYERAISKVKLMPDWNETLRTYLNRRLPTYMIPSHFMSVSTFPLSPNGKVDRKSLLEISSSILSKEDIYIAPSTELENTIEKIWREIIYADRVVTHYNHLKSYELPSITTETIRTTSSSTSNLPYLDTQTFSRISTTTSFFNLGRDSLLLVQIYQHYQSLLNFDNKALTIRSFFEYNTIAEHAKLLETIVKDDVQSKQWHSLHINNGITSFAQERIFLDEQVRFSSKIAIYNELIILRVVRGSLSIDRLQRALRCLLSKHKILRTSLIFNNDDSTLKQYMTNKHNTFTLTAKQIFKNENELQDIIYQTIIDPSLFDLSNGRVFHCQILRQQKLVNENKDNKLITESDVLIIAFHHVAFDRSCSQIFLNDLCNAYNSNETWSENEKSLQYIDYSVYERLIDTTPSREFWHSELEGYNFERPLSLPVDRYRLASDQRFASASVVEIFFDNNMSTEFLNYASSHHMTHFQLGLAIFYAFLFKLTHGQSGLCVSCINANRYRTELQNIIGMFVATLPYRIQLDSRWSFDELVKHVREKCLSILEHSHYPLQHILDDFRLNQSNAPFLETMFDFITIPSDINRFSLDGANLEHMIAEQSNSVAKFDFSMIFVYNPTSDDNQLSCSLICSRDIFEKTTVARIAQRFKYLFEQIYRKKSSTILMDDTIISINKLSVILPEEAEEIQAVMFRRLKNIVNEGMLMGFDFSKLVLIWK